MDSPSSRIRWYNHAALACYLSHLGFPIVETKWIDGICKWAFEPTQALASAIDDFFADRARVEPREFFKKVTDFKKAMYDANPEYVGKPE